MISDRGIFIRKLCVKFYRDAQSQADHDPSCAVFRNKWFHKSVSYSTIATSRTSLRCDVHNTISTTSTMPTCLQHLQYLHSTISLLSCSGATWRRRGTSRPPSGPRATSGGGLRATTTPPSKPRHVTRDTSDYLLVRYSARRWFPSRGRGSRYQSLPDLSSCHQLQNTRWVSMFLIMFMSCHDKFISRPAETTSVIWGSHTFTTICQPMRLRMREGGPTWSSLNPSVSRAGSHRSRTNRDL